MIHWFRRGLHGFTMMNRWRMWLNHRLTCWLLCWIFAWFDGMARMVRTMSHLLHIETL
jgi:hypothetical protein